MNEQTYLECMANAERTLYRIACGMLSSEHDRQDALIETAARCWAKRHTLKKQEYFTTWSARILINVCKGMYRRRKWQIVMTEPWPETPVPDRTAEVELKLSIEALEPKYRVVIVMHYLEGFSLQEMADVLQIPLGTVKFRMHQARKALKVQLDDGRED